MDRLGQYRIIRKLGAGAMGEVYLAEHALMRANYAVKVLPGELAQSRAFQERFVSEARVMAALRHPHIVQIHNMDREGDTYYIVMDFVSPDGQSSVSLDGLLSRRGGRLPHEEARRILLEVCDAVAYAHGRGVVHRDLKPSNVLLHEGNAARVSDFGLATVVGSDFLQRSIAASLSGSLGAARSLAPARPEAQTDGSLGTADSFGGQGSSRSESLVGTYNYMPPEVMEGGDWSPQGDIYSLGCLAYVMLTGRRPVGRFKLPGQLDKTIPGYWDEAVERALEPEPGERWETAAAFAKVIREAGETRTAQRTVSDAREREETRRKEEEARTAEARYEAAAEARRKAAEEAEERKRQEDARKLVVHLPGNLPLELVLIPAGTFTMGGSRANEQPKHSVTFARDFWLGKYPVTQAQWQAVMGGNPSYFKEDLRPVERVSWDDCQKFIEKLNGLGQGTFRLPSEAEWEYACRAGSNSEYSFGDDVSRLGDYAWYDKNSGSQTHPVGQKRPNEWSLYDMHGNVWEWCQDWYYGNYEGAPNDGSAREEILTFWKWLAATGGFKTRVLRGGSWNYSARYCRAAYRGAFTPDLRLNGDGFRVARTL